MSTAVQWKGSGHLLAPQDAEQTNEVVFADDISLDRQRTDIDASPRREGYRPGRQDAKHIVEGLQTLRDKPPTPRSTTALALVSSRNAAVAAIAEPQGKL